MSGPPTTDGILLLAQLPCPDQVLSRVHSLGSPESTEIIEFAHDLSKRKPDNASSPLSIQGFVDNWDEVNAELGRELLPVFARLDAADPACPWRPLDTWSHFLVSEINHCYAVWRRIRRLVSTKNPAYIVIYLPEFVHRGVSVREGLELMQRETTTRILDWSELELGTRGKGTVTG